MTNTNSSLTKTCSACGLQKPLSAFLQLSGKESGTYGSICSSCRQINKDKVEKFSDVEEGTRTTTTVTIDTKTKVQTELDQKQQRQQTEEDYHAERDKEQLIESDRTSKIDKLSKDQRKHRESLLGTRSFLSTTDRKTTTGQSPAERAAYIAAQEAHNVDQTNKQESATKEDLKEKDVDLSAPVEDTRFGKKEKHKGTAFQHFSYAQSQVIGRSFTDTQQKPSPEAVKDTPSEFIEKNWSPGSKRR